MLCSSAFGRSAPPRPSRCAQGASCALVLGLAALLMGGCTLNFAEPPPAPSGDCEASVESCDGRDNDCDGSIDEGCDDDGDGQCDAEMEVAPRDQRPASVCPLDGGDCDDGNPERNRGATETCNGVDDDCDGQVDERWPQVGRPCDGDDEDACPLGLYECTLAGDGVVCRWDVARAEQCNGADDDCDGLVDAQDPSLEPAYCPRQEGECAGARRTPAECQGGRWLPCTVADYVNNSAAFGLEICDGLDNDCDGATDADDPKLRPAPCINQKGVCAGSHAEPSACRETRWTPCGPADYAAHSQAYGAEVCDGLDNDCDGATDADDPHLVPTLCTIQVGVCAGAGRTARHCEGGAWTECAPADYGAHADTFGPEVCDGLDNDCDGATDADDPDLQRAPCDDQSGVCAGSLQPRSACVGGRWRGCSEPDYVHHAPLFGAEVCDGRDNDCDGATDEELVGPPVPGGQGVCATRRQTCAGVGGWQDPTDEELVGWEPVERSCDGLDNDCDGETDEELEPPDPPEQVGVCRALTMVCDGAGGWVLADPHTLAEYQPPPETACDDLDNDCDGDTDEAEAVTELTVTFDDRTFVERGHSTIEVQGGDGAPVAGSPFSDDELAGVTLNIPGDQVLVRLIVDDQAQPLFGYRIVEIADQTGRLAVGALPESPHAGDDHLHPLGVDDLQRYEMGDALGGGLTCGSDEGECSAGSTECVGGEVLCRDDRRPADEACDGLDNDCDGATDEWEDLARVAPLCLLQAGLCAGARQPCAGEGGFRACAPDDYPHGYEEIEQACDCQDNDCDGVTDGVLDGDAETLLGCTLDELAPAGARGRACVVQASSTVPSGEYHFGSLRIPAGVTVRVEADDGCGYPGAILTAGLPQAQIDGSESHGGGCLALLVGERLEVAGGLRADGSFVNPMDPNQQGAVFSIGGASGGDLVLVGDEVVVSGTLQANGANGSIGISTSTVPAGGAGGSIRIWGRSVALDGSITSRGGFVGNQYGTEATVGRGAGGAGGRGDTEACCAGAGAGGSPPSLAIAGPSDPARGVLIAGGLRDPAGVDVRCLDGWANADGYVLAAGEAAAVIEHVVAGADQRGVHPLAVRLLDVEGRPAEASWRLLEPGAQEAVAQGRTGWHGWATSAATLDPDAPYTLEVIDAPNMVGGWALLSRSDPATGVGCTLEHTLLPGPPPQRVFSGLWACSLLPEE